MAFWMLLFCNAWERERYRLWFIRRRNSAVFLGKLWACSLNSSVFFSATASAIIESSSFKVFGGEISDSGGYYRIICVVQVGLTFRRKNHWESAYYLGFFNWKFQFWADSRFFSSRTQNKNHSKLTNLNNGHQKTKLKLNFKHTFLLN